MSLPSSPEGKSLDTIVVVDSSEIISSEIPKDPTSLKEFEYETSNKKRKLDENSSESGGEDGEGNKKKRLNWSESLHQKFVEAVNKLGDKGNHIRHEIDAGSCAKKDTNRNEC